MELFPVGEDAGAQLGEVEDLDEVIDFEDEEGDDSAAKPLSGRRKKAARDKQKKFKPGSFETMGLSIPVLKAIKRKGFQLPTPIQRKTIPLILQGIDVVGMARTGSGKTAAFVIPLIEKLREHKVNTGARGVFMAPTREVALQTYKVVTEIGKHTTLRTAVLVGGDSMEAQFSELALAPDMLVATPGRLLHHLEEVPNFNLKAVQHIVLDEADMLFEMGLGDQVKEIVRKAADTRQMLLFSATMPAAVAEFARAGLRSPELVRLDADTKISPDLSLAFFTMRDADKPAAILQLVREVLPLKSSTLVFAATKHRVEYLSLLFEQEGIKSCSVYGAMDQTARKINVAKFRNGKVNLMIVTDVAARGIDIPLLDNVINYDFTAKPKLFVHRTGRAARAGRTGTAFSFLTPEDIPYAVDLHLFLSRPLRTVPVGAQAADDINYEDQSCSWLGSYPEAMLDLAVESVRDIVASNPSIQSLEMSCENAFSLYRKTRPAASAESMKRGRAMPKHGPHPLLLDIAKKRDYINLDAEVSRAHFTAALKTFRPAATVLEAQVAGGRRGEGAGAVSACGIRAAGANDRKLEVMRLKREAHAGTIQRTFKELEHRRATAEAVDDMQQSQAPAEWARMDATLTPGRFKDADFYITAEKGDRYADEGYSLDKGHSAIESAVMDINAEDNDGLLAQRKRVVWDNRKKKYVTLQKDETIKAGKRVKTDSGKMALKSNTKTGEIFQKWVKRTGGKMQDSASKGAKGGKSALAGRFEHGGRGWSNPVGFKRDNASGKDDVKSEGELRKDAKKKERMREHLQGVQQGGVQKKVDVHKGGKNTNWSKPKARGVPGKARGGKKR